MKEWGTLLNSDGPIANNPPSKDHGGCCYCTTCWHFHDECVCGHNEVLEQLAPIEQAVKDALYKAYREGAIDGTPDPALTEGQNFLSEHRIRVLWSESSTKRSIDGD